ncbi:hypothetical protein GCM10007979_45460 [Nocardioides albus]|nr:hypothetical protein GCM10007979_45460 [Nocardioides albus]
MPAVMITPMISTPAIALSPMTMGHGLCDVGLGGGPPAPNEFSFGDRTGC